jgi:hypothetical protein
MAHLLSLTKSFHDEVHHHMLNSRDMFGDDKITRISVIPVSKKDEKGFNIGVSVRSGNCSKNFKIPLLEETQSDHMLI